MDSIVRGRNFGPYHGENDPNLKFAELASFPASRARIDVLAEETNWFVKMLASRKTIGKEGGPLAHLVPKSEEKAQELVQTILVTTYTERFLGLLTREYAAPTDTNQPTPER